VLASFLSSGVSAAEPERFEFSAPHMGTLARIVVFAPGRSQAREASEAAFTRIAELDARLSDYRADSEVAALARAAAGPAQAIGDDLLAVLLRAQGLARRSAGAFDVTVGPLSRLWRAARRRSELPPDPDIEAARARVGHAWLSVDAVARRARLERAGMSLDLGAIAKGYAADEALRVLKSRGLEQALVTLGGEVVAGAAPPGQAGWSVALRSPGPAQPPLLLADAAASTSGDAEQWLDAAGVRYSHVVDPRTGRALLGRRSVTVVAQRGIDADSLATAVSVLGADEGFRLVEDYDAVALIVQEMPSGFAVLASPSWPQRE
jgi:thiamine biosynthesis lipoprotein